MICPFQNGNKCQEADCTMWKNDRCRITDAVDAVENISSSLSGIASDLEDIRTQMCPEPVPSSWDLYGGSRHRKY